MNRKRLTMLVWITCMLLSLNSLVLSATVTLEGGREGDIDKEITSGDENARLVCNTQGNAQLTWSYRSSRNSPSETDLVRNGELFDPETYGLEGTHLLIRNVVPESRGLYTCRAAVPGDAVIGTGTYKITVLIPPSVPVCSYPAGLHLVIGSEETLRCRSETGVPVPTYNWYKDDVLLPVSSQESADFGNSSFVYSRTTGNLVFAEVRAGDAGKYQCEASNGVGSNQRCRAATLTIAVAPNQLSTGVIIGIAVGCSCGVILIGIIIFIVWKKGCCNGGKGGREKKNTVNTTKAAEDLPSGSQKGNISLPQANDNTNYTAEF